MNLLQVRDADGNLIRERTVERGETIRFSLGEGCSYTVMPPPGHQLNGHRLDCRCNTCRPDIWRLP